MLPHTLTWSAPDDVTWSFGSFILWEAERRLECMDRTVRLGPRSLDLLLQFLKHPGRIFTKEELLASVWSGVVVDEGSVRVQVSALRKALGVAQPRDSRREWIVTVPMRGYRFVGRVLCQPADVPSVSPLVPGLTDAQRRLACGTSGLPTRARRRPGRAAALRKPATLETAPAIA